MAKNVQDMPPKGGYPDIQWKRNLPSRGFKPSIYIGLMLLTTVLGLIPLTKGIRERRELNREKVWARLHILPLLQAEMDRDSVRRTFATQKREQELMKDHADWADGKPVYHDGRFRLPAFGFPGGLKKLSEPPKAE
ncbi:GRIM-19 [Lipomyces oligophaga]|uniref:GRIM-19 n=1 Tax=Lipomyces oligophaga TaxID=45792 RepID=UPI0034CDBF84